MRKLCVHLIIYVYGCVYIYIYIHVYIHVKSTNISYSLIVYHNILYWYVFES